MSIRLLSLFLFLLHAGIAIGQPVIGEEVVSSPLPLPGVSQISVPGVAMAADRLGVAIAWAMSGSSSGAGRIYVARLDATGRVAGAAAELPVVAADYAANAPSIAGSPDGKGFTVAWLETRLTPSPLPSRPIAVYCRLDANLDHSVPRLLGLSDGPVLVRSGKTTWITAAGFLWQLRGDGTPGVPVTGGVSASDMDAGTDTPLLVSGRRLPAEYTCGSAPGCQHSTGGPISQIVCNENCRIYDYKYALQFLALYATSTSEVFSFDSDAAPAVHNDGREILIAWFRGTQSQGGQVVLSRLHCPRILRRRSARQSFSALSGRTPDRRDLISPRTASGRSSSGGRARRPAITTSLGP
ncbi:MAG: hypothetical protein ABI837_07720 [Acidobacteriota bacterium]